MIGKAAAAAGTAAPVVWVFLGYPFEAASMIAGLSACGMVRIWVSLSYSSRKSWAIDLTVTGISLLFTAGWVIFKRPEPFYALISGTGFGALGAGIIAIALRWVKKIEPFDGLGDEPATPRTPAENDAAAIERLREALLRGNYDKPLPAPAAAPEKEVP